MLKKYLIILLIPFAFSNELQAKFIFFGWGDEKIIKVMDLPDNEDLLAQDGDYVDLGYRYQLVTIFFVPVWNYNGNWCGYIGKDDIYIPMTKEEWSDVFYAYGLTFPDNPNIPFWDKIGGKLLIGALLLLYIYYKNFDKKEEDEQDIEIIEGDDAKLSQIERLASLKEKGHISAEEFQKKKKELL